MRVERSKEFWVRLATREGDAVVAAGPAARDPAQHAQLQDDESVSEEARIAFGRLVNLMRRNGRQSIDDLAQAADLDPSELVAIENDVQFRPMPRTVFNLARYFELSQASLMQLAGLSVANDDLREQAVRFAARSEGIEKLSADESAALAAFVAALADRQSSETP